MCVPENYRFYFSTKTYVVDTQKNRSFEHPKYRFKLLGKKIIAISRSKLLLTWAYGSVRNKWVKTKDFECQYDRMTRLKYLNIKFNNLD